VQAAQRTFEGKFHFRLGQTIQLSEHQAPSRYRCEFWAQRRNTASNEIGVDEVNESCNPR
jgi:hypothetical protein